MELFSSQATLPPPPGISRRITLTTLQKIVVPILLIIVLLAVFEVFGERQQVVQLQEGDLRVQFEYPARLRYGQRARLIVTVEQRNAALADSIDVWVSPEYLNAFIVESAMAPVVARSTVNGAESLATVRKTYMIVLSGLRSWRHAGQLRVTSAGDTVNHTFTTMTFP